LRFKIGAFLYQFGVLKMMVQESATFSSHFKPGFLDSE